MSIRWKLGIIFLVISLVPLTIFSVIAIDRSRQMLKQEIGRDFELLAHEKALEVVSILNRRVEEAQFLSRQPNIIRAVAKASDSYLAKEESALREIKRIDRQWLKSKGDTPEAREILDNDLSAFLMNYQSRDIQEYGEIFLTDRLGATLAMTMTLTDYYQADEGWWREGMAGGKGSVFLDDRGLDRSVKTVVIGVVVPVWSEGEVKGILKINFKMGHLPAIIQSPYLGGEVSVFLMRSSGLAVVDASDGLHQIANQTETRVMAEEKQSGWIEDFHDAEPTIMGYSIVRPKYPIYSRARTVMGEKGVAGEKWGRTDWHVFLERNQASAYAPIQDMMNLFISGGVLLALVVVFAAILTATTITNPLLILRERMEHIATGNLDIKLGGQREDEIGAFLKDIDRMVARLKETLASREELNREIVERKQAEDALLKSKKELENYIIDLDSSRSAMEKQAGEMATLAENGASLNKRLAQEIAIKNRFFSIISHDLKSPFSSLLGMTQAMSEMAGRLSKDKLVQYAGGVNEAGNRVFELLQNLLEWSRLQMEGGSAQPVVISVPDLVQESVEILDPVARKKNISVANRVDQTTAFADADMFKVIIRNLLANAIKFTPHNGSVDVTSKNVDGMIQITVRDTGVGLSVEQIDTVFSIDLKTSTAGTDGESGTGLGLPLCKDMVERNGGRIWVESAPGEGARFHFTLPVGPIEP